MEKQANSRRFFYQNSKPVSVNQGDQHRAIFRSDDIPLAEQPANEEGVYGILATDNNRSVLAVHAEDADEDSRFSPYGHGSNLGTDTRLLGFNGELITPSIECYLLGNGYRAYSPRLMRFLSPDSFSPFARGWLNAYAYCEGDPINNIDPSGHSIYKGIQNMFFGRPAGWRKTITQYNKNMIDFNKGRNKLQANYTNGEVNPTAVLVNNSLIDRLPKKPSALPGPVTERARKKNVGIELEDTSSTDIVVETWSLMSHKSVIKLQAELAEDAQFNAYWQPKINTETVRKSQTGPSWANPFTYKNSIKADQT